MTKPLKTQFPPRGPRSCHIKIDVTIEERKQAEQVAQHMGCSVTEAFKTAMRIQSRRIADHVPAVVREAESPAYRDEDGPVRPIAGYAQIEYRCKGCNKTYMGDEHHVCAAPREVVRP